MKLMTKYATQITDENNKLMTVLLDIVRSTEDEDYKLLAESCVSTASLLSGNYASKNDIKDSLATIKDLKDEEANQLLYSLCTTQNKGEIVIASLAIIHKLPKELFEFIMTSIDFKAFEKQNKISLIKYFRNKSEAKHKQLIQMKEVIDESLYRCGELAILRIYKTSVIGMIANAIKGEYKCQYNLKQLTDYSTAMSVLLETKLYNSVRVFLGMPKPTEITDEVYKKTIETYKIDELLYSNADIVKITNWLSYADSVLFGLLNGRRLECAVAYSDSILKKERFIHLENESYRNDFNKTNKLTIEDFKSIKTEKTALKVFEDRSYSSNQRNQSRANFSAADLNAHTYSSIKDWIKTYETDNLLGSLVSFEVSNYHGKSNCQGILYRFMVRDDKIMASCLIADIVNDSFGFQNFELNSLLNRKVEDKSATTLFYQDVQFIAQEISMSYIRDNISRSLPNR